MDRKIYRTENLKGPLQTNSWESSLLFFGYGDVIMSHPCSYLATENGLEIGMPRWMRSEEICMTNHHCDLKLIHSDWDRMPEPLVDKIGDWHVDSIYSQDKVSMKVTMVKASPYTYVQVNQGNVDLLVDDALEILSQDYERTLFIKVNGQSYGLFGPESSSWQYLEGVRLTCLMPREKGYLSIALLPDDSMATFELFREHAYAFISDTRIDWQYNEESSLVRTKFKFQLEVFEGELNETLIGLYPHQWKFMDDSFEPFHYDTARGKLKILKGHDFEVDYQYQGILPELPTPKSVDQKKMRQLIDECLDQGNEILNEDLFHLHRSTYFIGKLLNKYATLIPVAEQIGYMEAVETLLDWVKSSLENWFTAEEKKKDRLFYYSDKIGALIGYPASHGTDILMNDHHFHYGYFVQAAAHIALRDPEWASDKNWGGMVDMLIQDFACHDRNSTRFPYLRCFDVYEGHSWASGDCHDETPTNIHETGNNQESSSESINAWQSLILWGEATDKINIRDLGIYLMTTEIQAINQYWFNLDGDIFEKPYGYNYASIIWGGGYTHKLWWYGSNDEVHAINMLPMTPASLYLGMDERYVTNNFRETLEHCDEEGSLKMEDILLMYLALSEPGRALSLWNEKVIPEYGGSKAQTYHWLSFFVDYGTPEFNLSANTALYSVFNKEGRRTYVVYNAERVDKMVVFSDGTSFLAAANELTFFQIDN